MDDLNGPLQVVRAALGRIPEVLAIKSRGTIGTRLCKHFEDLLVAVPVFGIVCVGLENLDECLVLMLLVWFVGATCWALLGFGFGNVAAHDRGDVVLVQKLSRFSVGEENDIGFYVRARKC